MADQTHDTATLFDAVAEPAPKLSPDVRRRQRQAEALSRGWHPLGMDRGPHQRLKLHTEAAPADDRDAPGRRCGSCRWRQVLAYHTRSYPKCLHPEGLGADEYERLGPPRVSHGPGTDVRRWWPACTDHEYGDATLGPDAARCVPEAVADA